MRKYNSDKVNLFYHGHNDIMVVRIVFGAANSNAVLYYKNIIILYFCGQTTGSDLTQFTVQVIV